MKASQIGYTLEGRPAAPPVAILVVGGLDPGGGAGLVRDVLTAAALGARPLVVGTAWTEQGDGVHRVEARSAESVCDSLRQALAARPGAVKVGMIANAAQVQAIVFALRDFGGPVVLDPVLASSRGRPLFAGATADLLPLLRRATVVTPNAGEAAALSALRVTDHAEAEAAGRALVARGAAAVLVKGGHLGRATEPITDTLVVGDEVHGLTHPRVGGGDVRGTGCALATALAVELARGARLVDAAYAATAWLMAALANARDVGGERHLGDRS